MEQHRCGTSNQLITIANRHHWIEEFDTAIGKLFRAINVG